MPMPMRVLCSLLWSATALADAPSGEAINWDPPADPAHPARTVALRIPSHGVKLSRDDRRAP